MASHQQFLFEPARLSFAKCKASNKRRHYIRVEYIYICFPFERAFPKGDVCTVRCELCTQFTMLRRAMLQRAIIF
jgi:hypothetical protein